MIDRAIFMMSKGAKRRMRVGQSKKMSSASSS
jgi:hypothetical protein